METFDTIGTCFTKRNIKVTPMKEDKKENEHNSDCGETTPHICPFKLQVEFVETFCQCCSRCEERCLENI